MAARSASACAVYTSQQGDWACEDLPPLPGFLVAVDFIGDDRVVVASSTHQLSIVDLGKKGSVIKTVFPTEVLPHWCRIQGVVPCHATPARLLLWTADTLVKLNLEELKTKPSAEQQRQQAQASHFTSAACAWQTERRFRWVLGCAALQQPKKKAAKGPMPLMLAELPPREHLQKLQPPFERKRYGQ